MLTPGSKASINNCANNILPVFWSWIMAIPLAHQSPQQLKYAPFLNISSSSQCFLLCFLGQIVTWQYNPNLFDYIWPCTVIIDHNWQLQICPLTEHMTSHAPTNVGKHCVRSRSQRNTIDSIFWLAKMMCILNDIT